MQVLCGVAAELAPSGRSLTLLPSLSTGDLVPARDVPMDGALVYSCDPDSAGVAWLHKRDLPVVYIDQVVAEGVPSVNVDDRGGARAAAQHLLDLGHRRFGAIVSVVERPFGPVEDPARPADRPRHPRARSSGWNDALAPAGVQVASYVQTVGYDYDESRRAARILLDLEDRPTAVLCYSDLIAAAVVHEARDRGLEVPRDLSVVGFDDNPLARRTVPALTTVRQDSSQKGRLAAAPCSTRSRRWSPGPRRPVRTRRTTSCRPSSSSATAPVPHPWPAEMRLPPLVEPGDDLTTEEVGRYSRHLLLPEIGRDGQRRLKNARVLVVGAGGLGSPVLLYLAAAGVGTIGVVDDDLVDASNLQRQVVHGTKDVGRPKVDSAADAVAEVNPHVTVVRHRERITAENALALVGGYDLVLDGTDNFPTRYLVSDACVLAATPLVWGSILRFDGQVSVFWAEHGPTYRDLFPTPPPPARCRPAARPASSARSARWSAR